MATNPNLAAIQAAAAIAAKINASIGAGGGPVGAAPAPPVPTVFEATVDINFARSRANLVKGATQSQVWGAIRIVLGRALAFAHHWPTALDPTGGCMCMCVCVLGV
jgi:hypothetical protein